VLHSGLLELFTVIKNSCLKLDNRSVVLEGIETLKATRHYLNVNILSLCVIDFSLLTNVRDLICVFVLLKIQQATGGTFRILNISIQSSADFPVEIPQIAPTSFSPCP